MQALGAVWVINSVLCVMSIVMGQTASPTGDSGLSITTLLVQLGLSGVFLWQWRDERRERRDTQNTQLVLFREFVPALEKSTQVLSAVQESMAQQAERRDDELGDEVRKMQTSMEMLVSRLGDGG